MTDADAAAAAGAGGAPGADGAPAPEKPKRGRPKDANAPPKPKNPLQRWSGPWRQNIKETNPALAADLSAIGKAMKEAWEQVPQETKDKMNEEYQAEMEIWRPKWAAYKETQSYLDFIEVKTDYIDRKSLKKLNKKLNANAPKRAPSGYMLFANSVRDKVKEEVMGAGGGMGDIGKKISEMWVEVPEAKKAEYAEESARLKTDFEVKFVAYRKSNDWKEYCTAKAKMESMQAQKKNFRVVHQQAPKKAMSGKALYKAEVMPDIIKANAALPEAERTDGRALGKKATEQWDALSEDQKKPYEEKAAAMKKSYHENDKKFKGTEKYTKFLEKRMQIKVRENRLVNLRDMPKRPKSVFALFAEANKDTVPAGKGEGKGRSALKVKFNEADEEAKKTYQEKEAELKLAWQKELEEFKVSEPYKTFETTKKKIEYEFTNAAMKAQTLRFLSEAPVPPSKSAFALFVNEKRAAQGAPEGQPPPPTDSEPADESTGEEAVCSTQTPPLSQRESPRPSARPRALTEEAVFGD
eukprot:gnl/TRDRNA2_/TRDRNA2_151879_c0_seq3.p1 gnl/TRDRNA2_/TRDRNA2_151879_c0~~gnl/TRDRNA2_/TRDRNA2_151879_c0_seq3.p1  ORF type:complete len:524 (+),score=152.33 gnl/TRDRNA2_/TRDRNA2_151879_c0_seq3:85-1656(+)